MQFSDDSGCSVVVCHNTSERNLLKGGKYDNSMFGYGRGVDA